MIFDDTRLMLFVSSLILISSVVMLGSRKRKKDSASKKKENHWTILSIIICQFLMILTCFFETIKFTQTLNAVNFVGMILIIISAFMTHFSFKELGEFYSPVIEVKKKHKLINTGIYSLIRHPMDSANLLFMIGLPLIATAYFSLIWLVPYITILFFKIRYEELVLSKELIGYKNYMKKTKRLIPYLF